jgi:serine/threonine protein kinase
LRLEFMPDSFADLKRQTLEKRLADLSEEYQAANAQLGRLLSDVERLRIQRQIADLEQQIEQTEAALKESIGPIISQRLEGISWPRIFSEPAMLVGQSLASYNLLELLGSGGSGIVFRASHDTMGREVALKVFYPLDPSHASFYPLFEKGFRALGALEHPNIVRILDSSQVHLADNQVFYLAMEYIEGTALDAWSQSLANDKGTWDRRCEAAIVLAEALRAAHEATYYDEVGFQVRGVLHGDLKPANVLVTNAGDVKLLDFLLVDIQRLLDPRVVPPRFHSRKIPITGAYGTPGFMAPEQEGRGLVTVATDIYGLGITFCYLFFPFASDNPVIALRLGQDNEIPIALRNLIARMIDVSPQARPQTMQQVVEELRIARQQYNRRPGFFQRFNRLLRTGIS